MTVKLEVDVVQPHGRYATFESLLGIVSEISDNYQYYP